MKQESTFAPGLTVRDVLERALVEAKVAESEHEGRVAGDERGARAFRI